MNTMGEIVSCIANVVEVPVDTWSYISNHQLYLIKSGRLKE